MNKNKYFLIIGFLLFFCMNAFVISCSFILFLHNIELSEEQIQMNAKLTLLNVIFISLLFTIIDYFRQKHSVKKPIKRIHEGLDKIMKGQFNTKIEKLDSLENVNGFNEIIEDINNMSHELQSVETLRNDFISNVSHELKTPLSIIQNYSVLLQDDTLSEDKKKEYLKAIQNTTHRLADLVSNILKLNKLENQKIVLNSKTYNLSEQLCECILQYEQVWEDKKIHMEFDIEEDVIVNADEELLSIVWNNLISNALKFTNKNVYVGLKTEENMCVVKVMDDGSGMSNETGKHIFEKFYQAEQSHQSSGNGLGLALVKKVIELVNGEISVQSELNKGSSFEVRLAIVYEKD